MPEPTPIRSESSSLGYRTFSQKSIVDIAGPSMTYNSIRYCGPMHRCSRMRLGVTGRLLNFVRSFEELDKVVNHSCARGCGLTPEFGLLTVTRVDNDKYVQRPSRLKLGFFGVSRFLHKS